ncbi:MAG: HlyC/CorC family transporter [Caldilineaceae bacterium]|nr:HlyC/CorC family transporter [Caldilineaceae bacterium]
MEVFIPLGIISVLILLNGLFVAAEFSLIAAPPTRITQRAEAGSADARRVLSILRHPPAQNRYLATAQIGITVVSLGLGMYGEHAIAEWLLDPLEHYTTLAAPLAHTIATVVSVAILTYLHVVLGEMVAKSLALSHAETMALAVSLPMRILEWLLSPVIFVLNGLGNMITRLMGVPPAESHARLLSPQELEFIVEESYAGGLIEPAEQLFIENIFDLKERTVGQVMTPRTRIVGIAVDEDEATALDLVCETRHSRYPIYERSLDQIIGVLHVKDLARYRLKPDTPFDLHEFARLRPVPYVPDTVTIDAMLVRFRQERISLAIVVDEFGGTAGLLTLEDLVEEVVGEIQDEFDEETAPFEQLDTHTLRVQGSLLLDELNQHFDLDIDHPEVNTVGGLIMTELGRIPEAGDAVEVEGILFSVEEVEGMAVQTAQVKLPDSVVVPSPTPLVAPEDARTDLAEDIVDQIRGDEDAPADAPPQ